ncbi:MAG: glycosyltransferase family 1 protein [Acidimicrobiales bacterium]|nr:glycosyltransferase family 1 protein [Acidimicrobiales bacterium]
MGLARTGSRYRVALVDPHRRIAFVPPRYGTDVVGGAEASLREVAHGFADRGWDVDVLTTQARDHFTWANELPAGPVADGKLTVTRFPVVNDTPGQDRALVEQLLADGDVPTIDEQERWINDGLRSPALFHHLLDTADTYRAVVVSPYLFWTTFACGQIAPERTILRPCLHDEPYARLELFEPLFTGSAGRWLFTDPERDLLAGLYPLGDRTEVVGDGVTVPAGYDPDGFRRRHGLGDRRFVLYGGRREGGKGWDELLDGFAEAARGPARDLTLVTFGVGDVHPPADVAAQVVDLGLVSDQDRDDAFAAADAYLQPSSVESFSRTVMEAWLAGTPVIANADSAVVSWHCERSGAGVLYADQVELVECLRLVAEAPDLAAGLAKAGRDYVLDNYSWPAAIDRMEATIEAWLP